MNNSSLFCTWTPDHRLLSSSPYSSISSSHTTAHRPDRRVRFSHSCRPYSQTRESDSLSPTCAPLTPRQPHQQSSHTITQMMLHRRLAGQLMGACLVLRSRFAAPVAPCLRSHDGRPPGALFLVRATIQGEQEVIRRSSGGQCIKT